MGDKEDYLTSYRLFFENFAATVNPEDQLPVHIAGYTITQSEITGEVLYWITQYLSEKQCPLTLMTPLRRIILDEVLVASKKTPTEFGYKSDEAVYIALRLMQAVTARVNDVCLRYLDNARLDTLPPPPPLAQRDLKTVSCATKNSRRVMEDRHVEIGNLEALFNIETTEPTSFYAVYDGHAGSAAATYCAAHLHQYLVESPHFTTDLRRAMRDAYLRTDAEFIRKSNQERACGGSTAVTVAVRGRRLLAAWAGDSLALLAKRMRLMQLVRPHKPGRQDERERIESSGGTVMYWGTWRVNGQLAVSRAIGDAQYKPYVTARPEIATVDLDGDEDFVIVACDGLWDFVSEDDVALSVYRQIAADPDDLKAITKRLIVQAKRQGSADNISIIVVFLKNPRDIAADNCPPMDLGLDNVTMNAPPFTIETEVCKGHMDAAAAVTEKEVGECAEAAVDGNGIDNSDSDSEDLGPETAVDADDIDAEARQEPQPPTPPAHTLEEGHVDGALVDNVAESGEDSEDEWNYFKGEGEREEHNPSEEPDEQLHSDTPCQDNSAWESSSVDMNSSPLNPDAPVFVPGSVASADILLAESPRKPMPMDDIELPDVAQFETEAVVRPAELLDLDNCDQLNGHHNLSIEETVTEHLNGNDKCNMDSLGFGFNVGIEPDKVKDSGLIQDFERIQKDTTDFCNIQVFQTNAETNPFALEGNELLERLKNKERDPMSMSFYQEKDDDTCERIAKNELHVDLNSVQPLPDSDDEEIQTNGTYGNEDKENIIPEQQTNLFDTLERHLQEPNNDIMRFDDRPVDLPQNIENFGQDSFVDYNVTSSNIESYGNVEFESTITQNTMLQTDTPESHKLLFEQIPEIPDGKSSELGFTNDELQDPSENEKEVRPFTPQDEISQDVEMESQHEDSPCEETVPQLDMDAARDINDEFKCQQLAESNGVISPVLVEESVDNNTYLGVCPARENIECVVESFTTEALHENNAVENEPTIDIGKATDGDTIEVNEDMPNVEVLQATSITESDTDHLKDVPKSPSPPKSPFPTETLLHSESPLPTESPLPRESPIPTQSQLPEYDLLSRDSPLPEELSMPNESPLPGESLLHTELVRESVSPRPKESPLPTEHVALVNSPPVVDSPVPAELETPVEAALQLDTTSSPAPREVEGSFSASPVPKDTILLSQSPMPQESLLVNELDLPAQSQILLESPVQTQSSVLHAETEALSDTIVPSESPLPTATEQIEYDHSNLVEEPHPSDIVASPLPADVPLPGESPLPTEDLIIDTALENSKLNDIDETRECEASEETIKAEEFEISMAKDTELESDLPRASNVILELNALEVAPEETHVLLDPYTPLKPEDNMEQTPVEAFSSEEVKVPVEPEIHVEYHTEEELNSINQPTIQGETMEVSVTEAVSPAPVDCVSPAPVELEASVEPEVKLEVSAPAEVVSEETLEETRLASPAVQMRTDTATPECISPRLAADSDARLTPDLPEERVNSPIILSAPAPDLLPEEPVQQSRVELITDVDIGIPESRAQEICVPVTSEIQHEEAVQPPSAATPPPTPAVEPASALDAAPLSDTPIAADATTQGAKVAAAAVAAAGVAAGIAAVAAKTKSTTMTKKSPTTPTAKPDSRTPKSAPKSTMAPRTPTATATAKRPATASPATRTPTATKTPTSATKTTVAARSAPISRTPTATTKPPTAAAKTTAPATKTTSTTKPTTTTQARAPATARAPPSKPSSAAAKPAPAAARPATATRLPPKATSAPASRPATTKTDAAPKPAAARPVPKPSAGAASKPQPKPIERKPLTNGDAKDAKREPRPQVPRPTARPAPRPTPRATNVALASAPTNKTSAPKPLPRAAPLDKQSKDLANKRITAKTAPPRTAPVKSTAALGVKKAVPKKPSEPKEAVLNGLTNGDAVSKPPPSPPLADNALLPDVIA